MDVVVWAAVFAALSSYTLSSSALVILNSFQDLTLCLCYRILKQVQNDGPSSGWQSVPNDNFERGITISGQSDKSTVQNGIPATPDKALCSTVW